MSRVRKKKIEGLFSDSPAGKKKLKAVDLGWKGEDEHIDSDDEEEERLRMGEPLDDDSVEEEEALDAKRIRLARQYLKKLEGDSDDASSSSSLEESDENEHEHETHDKGFDRIGAKLQRERLKREGLLERTVAEKVALSLENMRPSHVGKTSSSKMDARAHAREWVDCGNVKLLRGHDLTPTCVALQSDGSRAISGSKDHSVLLWDIENEKRSHTLYPQWEKGQKLDGLRTLGEVLSVACSDDGRYAAIGRRDATVSIFDIRADKNNLVKTFEGHKGAVTCLSFRTQSLQLFSGSEDRCIRHHNLNEMMYLETLYGHQFGVTDIDCHRKERPISVGRDRTARAWKISEDTHLIFRGGAKVSSADCVNVIKDDWYMTGHDDGHLGLWMMDKKRAVKTIELAHGSHGGVGRGICSICTLKGSDLAVTGSFDGFLRLWKVQTGATSDTRNLEALTKIPLDGYINSIAVGPKARFCVVAVGQEPKLGRWNRVQKAKNRFGIISLRNNSEEEDDTASLMNEVPRSEEVSVNQDVSSSDGDENASS